jgi:hypothetical protein
VQKVLNYIAEIANADSAIVANVFWLVLFAHVGSVYRRLQQSDPANPETVSVAYADVLRTMLLNGIAMWVEWFGVVITRDTVFYWRRFGGVSGGAGPMTPAQTGAMVVGATLMIIGTVFMTYVLSRRTLGHSPWVASVVAVTVTTFVYLAFFPWTG